MLTNFFTKDINSVQNAATDIIDVLGAKVLPERIAEITKKHVAIGAAIALIPVPAVSSIATVANICKMYSAINEELNISLSENKLKSLISALIGSLGARVLLRLGVGELLKMIPGIGTAGGAVILAAQDAAITYISSYIYLNTLSLLAKQGTISDDVIEGKFREYMKENQSEIDNIFNNVEKNFEKDKSIIDNKTAQADLEKILKDECTDAEYREALTSCTKCGNTLNPLDKFCSNCGAKIA